ncbi:MAG TPA: hypothetical protein VIR16_09740 [Candidatus Limnocylindrales bacterium]
MAAPAGVHSGLVAITGGLRVPRLTKAGAATIAIGLLADAVEHTLVPHLHDAVVAGFPLGEHAAHLVVFIGMALVLVGIVAGAARPRGRATRQEGNSRNAVR